MAGKYSRCPNCYGQTKGATVMLCKKCNKTFCSDCKSRSWTEICPFCGHTSTRTLGYINNGTNSGGCFITTATLKYLGTDNDDCEELNSLRIWRDTFLLENYPNWIEEYYKVAPKIVEQIERSEQKDGVYNVIWNDYICKCLFLIKNKSNIDAALLYKEMVDILKSKYIGEAT